LRRKSKDWLAWTTKHAALRRKSKDWLAWTTKHAALRRKSKDWLAWNQDNVSKTCSIEEKEQTGWLGIRMCP
jgi:hypothetical protein